jgi:hypothetical protein
MQVRSITSDTEVHSFRLSQTIQTRYRDMSEADSLSAMLIEARRDPPAVMTTLEVNSRPVTATLIVASGLWSRTSDVWVASDIGNLPDSWALTAYRELGDMSLVAPLAAQTVVDAAQMLESEVIGGTNFTRFSAATGLMLQLLMANYHAGLAALDPVRPDSYITRYDADFWIDPATGFIHRERTVVEYTEERLHGEAVGTGPATFTTTRQFHDFNADVDIPTPDPELSATM